MSFIAITWQRNVKHYGVPTRQLRFEYQFLKIFSVTKLVQQVFREASLFCVVKGLATWTYTKYILAYCEKFYILHCFEACVCKKHPSNIDPQCQLSEIFIVMIKTDKWQTLNHIKKLNLKLYWKYNVHLLIQMYKIIFLFHIKYKKK